MVSQNYGERLGWDRIEGRIAELPAFIRAAKENTTHHGWS